MKLTLPAWLAKVETEKLRAAGQSFWDTIAGWLAWPLTQMDAETCVEGILDLLAYQRNIERFDGEDLALYRLRVKHAFINSVDSGSIAGIKKIFIRLGIGFIQIQERAPGKDWDIIVINMDDNQLSQNPELIRLLMTKYGRTCRRYEITTNDFSQVGIGCGGSHCRYSTDIAQF